MCSLDPPAITPASHPPIRQTIDSLLAERERTHGKYATHARIAQKTKRLWHLETRSQSRLTFEMCEALDMIAHKIGRILAGDPTVKDHWDDIAGYARLVANTCDPV